MYETAGDITDRKKENLKQNRSDEMILIVFIYILLKV